MPLSCLVFVKEPRAGLVKTRLCPPLVPDEAAQLYEAMLADLWTRLGAEPRLRTVAHVAPAEAVERLASHLQSLLHAAGAAATPRECVGQRGNDLAERMELAFAGAFERAGPVVLVGTDLPLLTAADVLAAHARLAAGADLVLAPDGTGGYGLIGLARPAPALFRNVRMSTSSVFDTTLALARESGLATAVLEPIADVDTAAELRALARRLEAGPAALGARWPSRTAACVRELCARHVALRA